MFSKFGRVCPPDKQGAHRGKCSSATRARTAIHCTIHLRGNTLNVVKARLSAAPRHATHFHFSALVQRFRGIALAGVEKDLKPVPHTDHVHVGVSRCGRLQRSFDVVDVGTRGSGEGRRFPQNVGTAVGPADPDFIAPRTLVPVVCFEVGDERGAIAGAHVHVT